MKTVKIGARVGKDGKPFEIEYKLAEDVAGLCKQFGDEVVYNNAKAALVVALQGVIRGALSKGKKPAEITEIIAKWKPGKRQPARPPQEKMRDQFTKLTADERKALLAELSKVK